MKLLLTLDYELFNGRVCGTVENCLIKPMTELKKVLDCYGFKATIFVDTVFINRLQELSLEHLELRSEYNLIVSQLKELSKNGHDLQLHIHPNWLYATYHNGEWSSIMDDYKLSDMNDSDVKRMFREGVELLENITGRLNSIIAYRAGAYCIQTYPLFSAIFKQFGIRVDSSVFRYQKYITEKWQHYDYTKIPKEYCYLFSNDVCVKTETGPFMEVSIPTYYMSKIEMIRQKLFLRRYKKESLKRWGDGTGSSNINNSRFALLIKSFLVRFSPSRVTASIDSSNGFFLKRLFKKDYKTGKEYMLIMGHPKNFTPYSLQCLEELLHDNKEYVEFATISEFYNCR